MGLKTNKLETKPANQATVDEPKTEETPVTSVITTKKAKDPEKVSFLKQLRNEGMALLKEEEAEGTRSTAGSLSDKVAYKHALGNPAKIGTRTEHGVSGIECIDVVGYVCTALADIKVPVCKREGIPKNQPMNYSSIEWVDVPKGQDFQLSLAEVNEMIILPEYDGVFAGNPEQIVEVGMSISKAAGNTYAVKARLQARNDGIAKPVKSNIIPVAKKINKDGKSTSIKNYEILPEYAEKFGYIFEESKGVGRVATPKAPRPAGASAREIAAALRANKAKFQAQQQ